MIPKWTGKKWSVGCFFLRIHWFRVGLLLGLGCITLLTSRRTEEQRTEAFLRRLKTLPLKAEIGSDDKSLSPVFSRQDIIRQSIECGINELRSNRYDQAERFLSQALQLDPENQTVLRLMHTCVELRHVHEGCPGGEGPCETCNDFEDQESFFPDLPGPIVFPDADQWEKIRKSSVGVAPRDCRISLDKHSITFQENDLALVEILGTLESYTHIEMELSPLIDGEKLRISVHWEGVVLRDILEGLCEELGLSMIVEIEKVVFIPKRTPWQ